jgi:acyl dehydratase
LNPLRLKGGEKLPTQVIGPFTHKDLAAYAVASGDTNPLHLDSSLAQSFGFQACPVHGMRLLAAFEQLLHDWRSDLVVSCLKGQFLTPVLVGQSATLSGRVAKVEYHSSKCIIVLRLMAHTDRGDPALIGEALMTAHRV